MNKDGRKQQQENDKTVENQNNDIQLGTDSVLWGLALENLLKAIQQHPPNNPSSLSTTTTTTTNTTNTATSFYMFDIPKTFPSTWKRILNGYQHIPSGFTYQSNTFPHYILSNNQTKVIFQTIIVHAALVGNMGESSQQNVLSSICKEVQGHIKEEEDLWKCIQTDIDNSKNIPQTQTITTTITNHRSNPKKKNNAIPPTISHTYHFPSMANLSTVSSQNNPISQQIQTIFNPSSPKLSQTNFCKGRDSIASLFEVPIPSTRKDSVDSLFQISPHRPPKQESVPPTKHVDSIIEEETVPNTHKRKWQGTTSSSCISDIEQTSKRSALTVEKVPDKISSSSVTWKIETRQDTDLFSLKHTTDSQSGLAGAPIEIDLDDDDEESSNQNTMTNSISNAPQPATSFIIPPTTTKSKMTTTQRGIRNSNPATIIQNQPDLSHRMTNEVTKTTASNSQLPKIAPSASNPPSRAKLVNKPSTDITRAPFLSSDPPTRKSTSLFPKKKSTDPHVSGGFLKRLRPDTSIFLKKIMKWVPPKAFVLDDKQVRFRGRVQSFMEIPKHKLPSTFRNSIDMVKIFSPFLLEEGRCMLDQEFDMNTSNGRLWNRPGIPMQLISCIPADAKPVSASGLKTYELALKFPRGKDPPQNLGEVYAINCKDWKENRNVLGVKGYNDTNVMFLKDQHYEEDFSLFRIWICVAIHHYEKTGWLAQSDLPSRNPDGSFKPLILHLCNIGTVAPIIRDFEGIKSLSSVDKHLANAVFCDKIPKLSQNHPSSITNTTDELNETKNIKPSSIPTKVWANLTKTMNPYQLNGIRKCVTGKAKENFMLLQGPPGTGKTATVVGLISSLLQSPCPKPNGKVGGTLIRVGTVGDDKLSNTVRSRILVCAPSNVAVDELAWRIKCNAIGPDGKKGSFNLVRFGACAGEQRHDGRKQNQYLSGNIERDEFLRRVNLDMGIEENYPDRDLDYDVKGRPFTQNRRFRHINYGQERRAKLENCHVVCTTLSSAGSQAFIQAVSRGDSTSFSHLTSEFDAVIIDEACQASEPSSLIPLKFNPTCVVLIGDPKQLPVTVLSDCGNRGNYGRSLFQRLQENGWPVDMLRMQYRMHDEIAKFPNLQFYNGKLTLSPMIHNRGPAPWYSHRCFPPFLVWNCQTLMQRTKGKNIYNHGEIDMIIRLLEEFQKYFREKVNLGIIAFYSEQVFLLKKNIERRLKGMKDWIQVSTVDGFQGSEKDIIILSCTRSFDRNKNPDTNIGFLADPRRLNVALTRARKSLWIVGNCEVLSHGRTWETLLNNAAQRYLIADVKAFKHLQGHNSDRQSHIKENNAVTKK